MLNVIQDKMALATMLTAFSILGCMSGVSSAATNEKYSEVSTRFVDAGIYAINEEEYEDAVKLLERAIVANPENSVAYIELARAYVSQGQYQKGVKYYDIALAIDPADLSALEGRALTSLKQMDVESARTSFQSIQRICSVQSCEELLSVSEALAAYEETN